MDDPFRSRSLVTLSSASSALEIFNLITNCPNATQSTLLRRAFPLFLVLFSSFSSSSVSLLFRPVPLFLARGPMKNSRRSIATELLAGRLYLWHSFSWRSRTAGLPFFSLSLFHLFLFYLINYLLIPRLILSMLSVLLIYL